MKNEKNSNVSKVYFFFQEEIKNEKEHSKSV